MDPAPAVHPEDVMAAFVVLRGKPSLSVIATARAHCGPPSAKEKST